MLKIKFGDAIALEIRRGIQEIDGVGHAILHRKFDGVHFIAQREIDGLCVFHDTRAEFGLQVIMFDQVAALLRDRRRQGEYRFCRT